MYIVRSLARHAARRHTLRAVRSHVPHVSIPSAAPSSRGWSYSARVSRSTTQHVCCVRSSTRVVCSSLHVCCVSLPPHVLCVPPHVLCVPPSTRVVCSPARVVCSSSLSEYAAGVVINWVYPQQCAKLPALKPSNVVLHYGRSSSSSFWRHVVPLPLRPPPSVTLLTTSSSSLGIFTE
jgi:hypothetical protein